MAAVECALAEWVTGEDCGAECAVAFGSVASVAALLCRLLVAGVAAWCWCEVGTAWRIADFHITVMMVFPATTTVQDCDVRYSFPPCFLMVCGLLSASVMDAVDSPRSWNRLRACRVTRQRFIA